MSRFDWRFEVASIQKGIATYLQEPVGQTIMWFEFDAADTQVDPIYDVGSATVGRIYKPPVFLGVIGVVKLEGRVDRDDKGLFVMDTLHITFSAQAASEAGLSDLILNPDQHDVDRLIWERKVFDISQVRVRGLVGGAYVICAVDANQTKFDELYNDPQFAQYLPDDFD